MTKKEFAVLASALKTYFTKEDKLLPNSEAMELWYRALEDIPFHVAEAAVIKWAQTHTWSPSIAELRETAATVAFGEIPDWGEGWRQVCEAMRQYGREYPKSAYNSMDEITAEAAKQLGSWWNVCTSENQDALRANFRKNYEAIAKQKMQERQMSNALRDSIAQIQGAGIGQPLLAGGMERK